MMTCGLSKSLGLPSSLKKQQGIVTILTSSDSDSSNTSSAPSLTRTFSANLSSKNWSSDSRTGFDIWTQIQEDNINNNNNNKKNKKEKIERCQSDIWSSILSEKKAENDTIPPPYVHPQVKRASSLCEKSLQICTESLGSETGCEGFSSENGDSDKVEEEESITVETIHTSFIEPTRGSFPPPIRSLTSQSGSSLHMKTRRDNGRLVLEAVSMPSHNNFSAKRQNGRLLLTFADIIDEHNNEIEKEDEIDTEVQWSDEEDEEEEEEVPSGLFYNLEQKPISPITVHRLAHKPIGVPKRNSTWPAATDESMPVVHSLPPKPRVSQLARSTKPPSTVDDTIEAACFNTCDYFWKPTNVEEFSTNTTKNKFEGHLVNNKSVGWINGCNEQRRSLLSMERFCITTS